MSEPADIAVFRLAELARKHVKVVLSGEGSDELFAGYPKYRVAPKLALAGRIPAGLRVPVIDSIQRWLPPAAARGPDRAARPSPAPPRRSGSAPGSRRSPSRNGVRLVGHWGRHRRIDGAGRR